MLIIGGSALSAGGDLEASGILLVAVEVGLPNVTLVLVTVETAFVVMQAA